MGVNPFRAGAVDVLRRMGAEIRYENERLESGEPVADIVVRGKGLTGTRVVPEEVPGLIDEIPALCVAAAFAEGGQRSGVRASSG